MFGNQPYRPANSSESSINALYYKKIVRGRLQHADQVQPWIHDPEIPRVRLNHAAAEAHEGEHVDRLHHDGKESDFG